MQLVELETNKGIKVWLNPDGVASLAPHTGSGTLTDIYMHGDSKNFVTYKGSTADIAKKINDALKA